jgi:hypothetical protein
MAKLTEAEIAAALSALEAARHHDERPFRKATHAAQVQFRSEAEKVIVPYLKKTGLDTGALQVAQKRAQTEMRRLAHEQRQKVVGNSASVAARLRSAEKSWRDAKSFRYSNPKLAANFVPPVLDAVETASMIVPSSGLEIDDFAMEPVNNWAKIKGHWTGNASENLRFIFMWSNPNDRDTVINAASYLSVNGSCNLDADGGALGIFPGGTSGLGLTAFMDIWELWNQPPSAVQTETLVIFSKTVTGGGWFGSVGAVETFDVNESTADLVYYQLVLPPNGAVAFEVNLQVGPEIDGGSVEIDFSSGSFEVKCPLVEIGILS